MGVPPWQIPTDSFDREQDKQFLLLQQIQHATDNVYVAFSNNGTVGACFFGLVFLPWLESGSPGKRIKWAIVNSFHSVPHCGSLFVFFWTLQTKDGVKGLRT